MAASKILIVEDEQAIREMIAFHLTRAGFKTIEAADCRTARGLLADERPALAIIDWMLPDMSGLELTRMLKRDKEYDELSIIMLTARAEERDKVAGLEGGADDYITKPFSPRELVARIQAVLRRGQSSGDETISAGILELDAASHRVSAAGQEIKLGPTEYRLLEFLMTHPDRVYTRSQLLDRIWGANVYVEERTVDVHVRRLRKALSVENADQLIQTVRGSGYRFSARVGARDRWQKAYDINKQKIHCWHTIIFGNRNRYRLDIRSALDRAAGVFSAGACLADSTTRDF
jgi:two-component system phosphate regulon response regulator PhoB